MKRCQASQACNDTWRFISLVLFLARVGVRSRVKGCGQVQEEGWGLKVRNKVRVDGYG